MVKWFETELFSKQFVGIFNLYKISPEGVGKLIAWKKPEDIISLAKKQKVFVWMLLTYIDYLHIINIYR